MFSDYHHRKFHLRVFNFSRFIEYMQLSCSSTISIYRTLNLFMFSDWLADYILHIQLVSLQGVPHFASWRTFCSTVLCPMTALFFNIQECSTISLLNDYHQKVLIFFFRSVTNFFPSVTIVSGFLILSVFSDYYYYRGLVFFFVQWLLVISPHGVPTYFLFSNYHQRVFSC